jgi:hypothetical protein
VKNARGFALSDGGVRWMALRAGWVSVVLLAASCALPTVDGTGAIEAGAGGACPPGQLSRWGRCCPEEAPLSVCPGEAFVPNRASGAIACSAQGACEQGYACRFGRCCPPESTVEQCPAPAFVPNAADGTIRCDAQGRCPNAHGYTCRRGITCCPEGATGTGPCAPGAPGNACTAATMCAPFVGAAAGIASGCLTEAAIGVTLDIVRVPVTNGVCSAPCDPSNFRACGADGYCIGGLRFPGAPADQRGVCAPRCRHPAGQPYAPCRTDRVPTGTIQPFSCFPLAPDDPSSTEGYCFPDCVRDDFCARLAGGLARLRCNPATHGCEPVN